MTTDSPLGRGEGHEALGGGSCPTGRTHPGAARPLSLRATPPTEGISLAAKLKEVIIAVIDPASTFCGESQSGRPHG